MNCDFSSSEISSQLSTHLKNSAQRSKQLSALVSWSQRWHDKVLRDRYLQLSHEVMCHSAHATASRLGSQQTRLESIAIYGFLGSSFAALHIPRLAVLDCDCNRRHANAWRDCYLQLSQQVFKSHIFLQSGFYTDIDVVLQKNPKNSA